MEAIIVNGNSMHIVTWDDILMWSVCILIYSKFYFTLRIC